MNKMAKFGWITLYHADICSIYLIFYLFPIGDNRENELHQTNYVKVIEKLAVNTEFHWQATTNHTIRKSNSGQWVLCKW